MARVNIIGGPDLRARLNAVANAEYTAEWAADTIELIRHTKPPSKRSESNRWSAKWNRTRAAVYGAYWWVFVDRGTKRHEITGTGNPKRNPPYSLKFQVGGRTIFSRKVTHPRTTRRPFITKAAQEALAGSSMAKLIIKSWNFKRLSGPHKRFL